MGEPKWEPKPSSPAPQTAQPQLSGASICRGPSKKDGKGLGFAQGDKLFTPREGPPVEGYPLKVQTSNDDRTRSGTADLAVSEGDGPYAAPEGRTVSGREANQPSVDEGPCEQPPDPAMVDVARTKAFLALGRLNAATIRAIQADTAAQAAAWRRAMKRMAGNPEISLDKEEYKDWVGVGKPADGSFIGDVASTSLGSGFSLAVEKGISRAAKGASKLGSLAKIVSGGVGGFLVGVVGSLVFDAIMALFEESEAEKEAKTTEEASDATSVAHQAVLAQSAVAENRWLDLHKEIESNIANSFYPQQLVELTAEIQALEATIPKAPVDSDVLALKLLERWTLQHARDPESPDSGTNEVAWNEAAKELDAEAPQDRAARGSQWRKRQDGRIRAKEMFREQLRIQMGRIGLPAEGVIAAVAAVPTRLPPSTSCEGHRQPPIVHRITRAQDPQRWSDHICQKQ